MFTEDMAENEAPVGTAVLHIGDHAYNVRLTRRADRRLLLELWEPLTDGRWAYYPLKLPAKAPAQVARGGMGEPDLALIDNTQGQPMAAGVPVQMVGPRYAGREPGGPYNDGGVAEYFVEVGGRALQVVPGHGVVVLVPTPHGAQVYEPEHAIALGERLITAGQLAAAAAHQFPPE